MNRNERRAYLDRMRKDQAACFCPSCKRKTRHFTKPSNYGEGKVDIICEYCNNVIEAGIEGYPPYIYVKVKENRNEN